ncbi:bacillithiol biosynthesis deacetylase BshB2 [Bacillus sp. CGMCC 1.16607]|uniref:bacillithiol biosynthesis deacetylase BshB2 n=1 Tax=Bacillus sp. CGMCC 1.16607 TaxID=3351842 RepID=UPI0036446BFD
MEKERQVLVVFPHPDDEAFGVSGTIATYVNMGTPVTYACLTLGEMGRNMGNPLFANRETLPLVRKKELEEAASALGITDLRMMGIRDKTVEFVEEEKLVGMMTSLLEELKPSLVITFYPGYSVHPDHEACGAAVVKAVGMLAENERPKLHCVAFSKNCEQEIGKPDIVNTITDVLPIKLATLRAHRSQTEQFTKDLEQKLETGDDQILTWLQNERFWTYKF